MRNFVATGNTFEATGDYVPVHVWGPLVTATLIGNMRVMLPGQLRVKPFVRISNTTAADVITEIGTVEK